MATRPSESGSARGVLSRCAGLALGVALLAWVAASYGPLWAGSQLRKVAEDLVAGASFRQEALQGLESQLTATPGAFFPYPDFLRSVAIVRLRQSELEYEKGRSYTENGMIKPALAAVRAALTVAPTDSYLWYSRCWFAVTTYQSPAAIQRALSLSYQTGAHEGWVAVKRSLLGLTVYPVLDHSLRASVVGELQDLMQSDELVPVVVEGLTGPAAKFRDQLLPAFAGSPEASRKKLASYLTQNGIEASVPGIPRGGDRPWR